MSSALCSPQSPKYVQRPPNNSPPNRRACAYRRLRRQAHIRSTCIRLGCRRSRPVGWLLAVLGWWSLTSRASTPSASCTRTHSPPPDHGSRCPCWPTRRKGSDHRHRAAELPLHAGCSATAATIRRALQASLGHVCAVGHGFELPGPCGAPYPNPAAPHGGIVASCDRRHAPQRLATSSFNTDW
jgi:hypothetical protein